METIYKTRPSATRLKGYEGCEGYDAIDLQVKISFDDVDDDIYCLLNNS